MALNVTKITLRLPPELHVWLKRRAAEEGRSLNSEIVQRLKQRKK
jgi:predicted HicB family RNase H-like nuclease